MLEFGILVHLYSKIIKIVTPFTLDLAYINKNAVRTGFMATEAVVWLMFFNQFYIAAPET